MTTISNTLALNPTLSQQHRRFIRLPEVESTAGIKRSKIYKMISAGSFPRQIKLGTHTSVWDSIAIQQWQIDQIAASAQLCEPSQPRLH